MKAVFRGVPCRRGLLRHNARTQLLIVEIDGAYDGLVLRGEVTRDGEFRVFIQGVGTDTLQAEFLTMDR